MWYLLLYTSWRGSRVQAQRAVGARGQQPGLVRMPAQVEHSERAGRRGSRQLLQRHQQRVREQVVVHRAVTHHQVGVVATRREQRVPRVEGHRAYRPPVHPQRAVGASRQLQVEPHQLAVVGAEQQVVSARMHRQRAEPLGARSQLAGQFLLHEVVDADGALRGHEQQRPAWVEHGRLHQPARSSEWELRAASGQLVHHHRARCALRHRGRQVVASGVPRQLRTDNTLGNPRRGEDHDGRTGIHTHVRQLLEVFDGDPDAVRPLRRVHLLPLHTRRRALVHCGGENEEGSDTGERRRESAFTGRLLTASIVLRRRLGQQAIGGTRGAVRAGARLHV